ncbi:unnamed protein product [Sphenostylis stenocarpa]|uniref:Uncharacterized protein n=1 Tax=Sphenostylis stenocarpa TaxID=92480 RepID=A0AA86VSK9_9FABA|nr:unnamed protein product [Sphenostylis stenocarpa]
MVALVCYAFGKVRSVECWENGYFSGPYTERQHLGLGLGLVTSLNYWRILENEQAMLHKSIQGNANN